jgi:hypothetical protein
MKFPTSSYATGPGARGATPHAVKISAANIHSDVTCFNRLSVAAEAFTMRPRRQNPFASCVDYNAKLSAPSESKVSSLVRLAASI